MIKLSTISNCARKNLNKIVKHRPQIPQALKNGVHNHFNLSKDSFMNMSAPKKAAIGISAAVSMFAGAYVHKIRKLESDFFKIRDKFHYNDDEITDDTKEFSQELTLKTKNGGNISVWDINPDDNKKYAVICLGFGCPKDHIQAQKSYMKLMDEGYGVIAFDYLGWGESDGDGLSQKGTKESLETVFSYLHNKGIEDKDINLIAHSLGCGVAADYAKNHDVESLILINPFNRLKDMVKKRIDSVDAPNVIKKVLKKAPGGMIPLKNKFNNEKALKHVHCPTLIIHSTDDKTIPVEYAQRLHNKTRKNSNTHYQEFSTGGHFLSDEKVDTVLDFLTA